MFIKQAIGVGSLLLDLNNYRHGKLSSQKEARDAIIEEQGKKLTVLAKDIIKNGLSPFDLPLVIDAEDEGKNFIVIEGNRRLTAINLLLKPELAEGTPIHAAFRKLSKDSQDAIPRVIDCVIAPNKKKGLVWINRKHASGLEGAGTDTWTAVAKARADAEQGIARPDLDAMNFVLASPNITSQLRDLLKGSKFNITTLERLITTSDIQEMMNFKIQDGRLVSQGDKDWTREVISDFVEVIANGKYDGADFTERTIDTREKRREFAKKVIGEHGSNKPSKEAWCIAGEPIQLPPARKAVSGKSITATPSLADQPNLIPKKFRLELPSGKINDIFTELKKLDVTVYRHSVSVLFRVFVELSIEDFIKHKSIDVGKDGKGNPIDKLSVRISRVLEFIRQNKLMTDKELKPLNISISDQNSLLSTDTLNAYVHSPWLNPEPLQLKVAWANIQPFMQVVWADRPSPTR